MREGQPQMDYPASKLAELEETRVMKHENPTFYLLAQDSQPWDLRWMTFSVDFNENRILRFHGNGTPSNQLYLSAFPAFHAQLLPSLNIYL